MEAKNEKTLSALLWGLAKNIVGKVEEALAKGELIKTRAVYMKPKIESFEYKEGSASYTTSFNYVEKEEWHWRDQHDFIQKVIKQFPEYAECVKEIVKSYKVSESQTEFWLSRFVQILTRKAIEPVSDEFVADQVTTFINDLEKVPTEWKLNIWVDGIWPKDERYELQEGMVLRRTNRSDMEEEIPFDMLPFHYRTPAFNEVSSSVIEYTFRCKETVEAQRETELILDMLRLFRLGSVHATRTESSPKSFINIGGISSSIAPVGTNYRYAFGKEDVEPLASLFKRLKPILPHPFDAASYGDPLSIAFQRYKEALLQPVTIESRITSAITCLEALYLKAQERAELSHRLGQRVSALLRVLGFNPLEVFNNLTRAYDIRSTFIHGSPIEKDQQQSAGKLCESVMEYARVSLLIFFQLKGATDKEKMINRLDNSLLDENALQKIKELVTKNVITNKTSYVWYVGYGSNLSEQRFLCYILGGKPTYGNKTYTRCRDNTPPVGDKFYKIPYRLYFALPDKLKDTDNWGPGGVAFIGTDKEEHSKDWTLGRMWKITKEQYEEVRDKEGRPWYDKEVYLGEEDGVPICAITNSNKLTNILSPSNAYLKTIALGLEETYNLNTEEIAEYLMTKEGVKGKIAKKDLTLKIG